jgi:DNA adenine methylase
MRKAKPIIKIPGGKRQLSKRILEHFPVAYPIEHYYEPFAGGLAVFFAAWNSGFLDKAAAHLSDVGPGLMNLYQEVLDDPEKVLAGANRFVARYMRDPEVAYYALRDEWNGGAQTGLNRLLISKTGFNGLWRMNKKGELNVAWNKESKIHLPDLECLTELQHALHGTLAQLNKRDFKDISSNVVKRGTVLYLDPPYHGGFTGYNHSGFSDDDHVKVVAMAAKWSKAGAHVILSCSATEQMRIWIGSHWPNARITEIEASRRINRDGAGRKGVKELLCISSGQ